MGAGSLFYLVAYLQDFWHFHLIFKMQLRWNLAKPYSDSPVLPICSFPSVPNPRLATNSHAASHPWSSFSQAPRPIHQRIWSLLPPTSAPPLSLSSPAPLSCLSTYLVISCPRKHCMEQRSLKFFSTPFPRFLCTLPPPSLLSSLSPLLNILISPSLKGEKKKKGP
jgi:hypothetical protein